MEKVVVDTSVAVKWFSLERGKEAAAALRLLEKRADLEIEFFAPDLIIYELLNALKIGKALKKRTIAEKLRDFWDLGVRIIPVDHSLVDRCLGLMFKERLTAYDAVFVALAESLGVSLLTADKKHHRKRISPNIVWLLDYGV